MTDIYPLACKHGRVVVLTGDKRLRGLTQACPAACPADRPREEEAPVAMNPLEFAIRMRLDEIDAAHIRPNVVNRGQMVDALNAVLDVKNDDTSEDNDWDKGYNDGFDVAVEHMLAAIAKHLGVKA